MVGLGLSKSAAESIWEYAQLSPEFQYMVEQGGFRIQIGAPGLGTTTEKGVITIDGNTLGTPKDLFVSLAHEMGHAIDPAGHALYLRPDVETIKQAVKIGESTEAVAMMYEYVCVTQAASNKIPVKMITTVPASYSGTISGNFKNANIDISKFAGPISMLGQFLQPCIDAGSEATSTDHPSSSKEITYDDLFVSQYIYYRALQEYNEKTNTISNNVTKINTNELTNKFPPQVGSIYSINNWTANITDGNKENPKDVETDALSAQVNTNGVFLWEYLSKTVLGQTNPYSVILSGSQPLKPSEPLPTPVSVLDINNVPSVLVAGAPLGGGEANVPILNNAIINGDADSIYEAVADCAITLVGSLKDNLYFGDPDDNPEKVQNLSWTVTGQRVVSNGGNTLSWMNHTNNGILSYQFTYGLNMNPVGTLTISTTDAGNDKYVINNFNIALAGQGKGIDGIIIPNAVAIGFVPTSSSSPAFGTPQNVSTSSTGSQFIDLSLLYAPTTATTYDVTVTGANGSDFAVLGSVKEPLDNNSFSITVQPGQSSVSFELVDAGGQSQGQTLQVSAVKAGSTDSSDTSNVATINFAGAPSAPTPNISLTDLTSNQGTGQVNLNGAQLVSGSGNGKADTWTDQNGTTYQFTPNVNADIYDGNGTLTISGGSLPAGDQLTIAQFNLGTATTPNSGGYLGLSLQGQFAMESVNGTNPFNTGGTISNASASGTGSSVSFYLDTPSGSLQTRTLNLTLSGGDASKYQVVVDIGDNPTTYNFTGNVAAIKIPAGAVNVACDLNYIGSGNTPQTVSLTLSAPQGAPAIETNTLNLSTYSAISTGTANYYGSISEPGNYHISNDTITVTDSNKVIVGNGTPSIIEGGAQNNGGNTIFADAQIPLATALANTQSQAPNTVRNGSFLYTQNGNNTIVGGAEPDTIATGTGNNLVILGADSSTYVGGLDVTGVASTWSIQSASSTSASSSIVGGNVQFAATTAPAAGYYGNSFVNSNGVTNTVGGGNDTIYGGAGYNTYFLSNGNNYLDAGNGGDLIYAGTGQNTIFAGSGADVIHGAGGSSYIDTESGNDTVYLEGGHNTVYGGSGNETIYSGNALSGLDGFTSESNVINCGSGSDAVYGAGGNDTIYGGSGTAVIYAGNGNEVVEAGSGNTNIYGGNGIDSLVGGSGTDGINAGNGGTQAAPTTIVGGSGQMVITGGSGFDIIYAGDGGTAAARTSVQAGSGATTIYGGAGVDALNGGAGNDLIYTGDGGTAAAPTIVVAGSGATTVNGGAGVDSIRGGAGNDILNAGDGGLAGAPTKVTAGSGATTINGGAGVDSITGGTGTDVLNSGDGGTAAAYTTVKGGSQGNDTLAAGLGYASLVGGAATNTYQIEAGGGTTTISSTHASDTLVFGAGLGVGDLAGITQSGASTVLNFNDGTSVTVVGTNLTQATFGDGTTATFAQLLSNQFTANGVTESAVSTTLPQASGSATNTLNLYGSADLVGQGNNVNDIIIANAGYDTLIAGTANNTLVGGGSGGGAEVYEVQSVSGTVTTINASTQGDTLVFATGTTLANLSVSTATDANGNLDVTIQNSQGGEVVVNGVLNSSANGGDGSSTLLDTLAFANGSSASLSQLISQLTTGATAATSGSSVTLAGGLQNMTLKAANIAATGNDLDNVITAGGSNDTLIAGSGSATLSGGGFGNTTYEIGTGSGDVSITNSSATDTLVLGSGITESDLTTTSATVNGQTVTTLSESQGGTITIQGALANISFADGSSATLTQLLAPSYTKGSTTYSQVSASAGNGITTLALTGSADITGTANNGNMTLIANAGIDTLVAGSGSDTLVGGGITDDYVIAAGSQTTTIANSSQSDAISFGTGVTASDLSASESTVGGAEVITLTNSLGGTVNIEAGNGQQVDTILFADGSTASLGAILAQNTTGASAATSAVDIALPEGIQNMQLTGSTSITVTANELDDVITANAGNDTLVAGAGDDTLVGSTGSTTYDYAAGDGNLVIRNSSANDVLVLDSSLPENTIAAANAVVNGQAVVELTTGQGQTITIAGGLGQVTFGDGFTATMSELLGDGYTDTNNSTTYSKVSTTAGAGITTLALTGNASIIGTANGGNDTLIANSGNDTLVAGAGKDTFIGGAGDTTYSMAAGYGAATIEGAGSDDTIAFGTGVSASNVFFVETKASDGSVNLLIANTQGNTVTVTDYTPGMADTIAFAGGQTESIQAILAQSTTGLGAATSAVSVSLPEGIQNMTLTGTGSVVAQANDEANVITANSGNDTLIAGTGSDTLVGGSGATTYVVSAGDGNITINNSAAHDTLLFDNSMSEAALTATSATINGQTVVTITNAEGGTITLNGGALNQLSFADGNITLAQLLSGSYTVGSTLYSQVNATAGSGVTNVILTGSADISATGNSLADTLVANSGNDTLIAGAGPATLVGGAGNDTFVVNSTGDVISKAANTGNNTEISSVPVTLAANLQNLTGSGTNAIILTGNSGNNVITANGSNDTLVAGSGNDTLVSGLTGIDSLVGGAGNDTFVVNNIGDVISEAANSGNNTEDASVSVTLANNVQNLTGIGTGNLYLTGNSLAHNVITANNGNDTLFSGSGVDTLIGGAGNDMFVVTNAASVIVEAPNNGSNLEKTSVSVTLAANVQNLTGFAGGNLTLTGNNLANVITANNANDVLIAGTGLATLVGGSGTDVFVVDNSSDVITEAATNTASIVQSKVSYVLPANLQTLTGIGTNAITLTGNNLADTLTANSANDTLVAGNGSTTLVAGTTGTDSLVGGTGNDTFVVNNTADIINEATANTASIVQSNVSYVMPANLQTLVGIGSNAITLTGNSLADLIVANGNNDTLVAGSGNDTLVSGIVGTDSLVGGAGNDTFIVNNIGDVISEAANSGNNTEDASVSVTLANNVQNLTGIGTGNLYLTGNSLAHNVITANNGNDTLFSGSGIDTLIGGTGNDTFVVTNAATVIQEAPNSGSNLEKTSVSVTLAANVQNLTGFASGNLTLIGNNLNNTITANSGNDLLVAGSGADTLVGSTGADVLEGGSGNDVMNDSSGANAMIAGSGNDSLNAGSGAAFLAGGTGNDAITLGSGQAVVAFNSGNGPAAITAGSGSNTSDVLSLGGGIAYANLSFSKSGNNLILNTGGNNAITFNNWYGGSANQNFVTLQVIEQAAATYSATSSNPLYNSEVETFSFTSLVADFNAALAANPGLTSWSLSNTLLNDHLASSNTAALGGDLAYYDGLNGNLTGLNLATAATTLQGSGFGSMAQTVDAWSGVSGGANKLH